MSESHPLPPHGQGIHPAITPQPHGTAPKITGVPTMKAPEDDLEPISLVDEPAAATAAAHPASKIRAFVGAGPSGSAHAFKRQPVVSGRGAIRVRSFHGRLSDEGMQFMDDKINEWVDLHPEIEIKFVTTTIGQFEGKIREPALVVNVWY